MHIWKYKKYDNRMAVYRFETLHVTKGVVLENRSEVFLLELVGSLVM